MFAIDPTFDASSTPVGELPLCHVRLHRDARYPWLLLIPRVADARELEDLAAAQRLTLVEEVVLAGQAVRAVGETLGLPVSKLNLGLLGNITPQLHAHVIGRRVDDPAWPDAVWGHSLPVAFLDVDLEAAVTTARKALGL